MLHNPALKVLDKPRESPVQDIRCRMRQLIFRMHRHERHHVLAKIQEKRTIHTRDKVYLARDLRGWVVQHDFVCPSV
jgi:hypothetical protein